MKSLGSTHIIWLNMVADLDRRGGGIDASSLVKNADSYSWLCLSCAHATLDPRRNGLSDDKAFNSSCLNGIISNDISRFNLSMVGGA